MADKLKKLEGFYYYQNWRAGRDNKIHTHDCGFCKYGAGADKDKKSGWNGVWVGPFKTKELAQEKILLLFGKKAKFHSACFSKLNKE